MLQCILFSGSMPFLHGNRVKVLGDVERIIFLAMKVAKFTIEYMGRTNMSFKQGVLKEVFSHPLLNELKGCDMEVDCNKGFCRTHNKLLYKFVRFFHFFELI